MTNVLTPTTLREGTRVRVRRAFHAAGRDVPAGAVLRFQERIYNRETSGWLFRFSGAFGDIWLIEEDPAGIIVLRVLDAYLEVLGTDDAR